MPRVKVEKVLDKIESEMRAAVEDVFREMGITGHRADDFARRLKQRLVSRTTRVNVPDSAVS